MRFYPTRTKGTKEIINVLCNYLWWHVGLPRFVLTDHDAAYRSDLARDFASRTGVEFWHTAPYSSWELGRVERRHRMLNTAQQLLPDKSEWPDSLPGATAFYNCLRSTVTQVAPAEVEYGYLPRGTAELAMGRREDLLSPAERRAREANAAQLSHHRTALVAARRVFRTVAHELGARQRHLAVERKNRDAKGPSAGYEFKVGDRIKVLRPRRVKGIPQKALTQWRGPYTVTAVKGARIKCRRMDGGAEFLVGRPHVQLYTAGQVDLATAAAFEAAQPSAAAAFAPGQLIARGQ